MISVRIGMAHSAGYSVMVMTNEMIEETAIGVGCVREIGRLWGKVVIHGKRMPLLYCTDGSFSEDCSGPW